MRIGFVLLTHRDVEQVRRLVLRLTALYDSPLIVHHHDSAEEFPNTLRVEPGVDTSWGGFGIVEATLAAFRVLVRQQNPPDWFVLLSGSDYPVKSPDAVRADLAELDCDVSMDAQALDPSRRDDGWHDECVRRYFGFEVPVPRPAPHGLRMEPVTVRNAFVLRLLSPYSRRFRCYAGSQWFTARTSVAARMLDWHDRNPWLAAHLEQRWCADETFFQTIAGNLEGIRISDRKLRFVDWAPGAARPRVLGLEDLPAVLASGAHFARKFAPGSPALDELDRRLGG